MKAILLAAGYATRLYPLTETRPKMLLPIAGRPILDRIADNVDDVPEIDELHVVTNARFAAAIGDWAGSRDGRLRAVVHDDGTTSNDDRLGAIGDIHFVIEQAGLLGDDLLVLAGDNVFEFGLGDFVRFWETQGIASAVALYDCGSLVLASHYGVAAIDGAGRITAFVEKPPEPPTTLVSTAAYIFHREHVPLFERYYAEGHSLDAPGSFLSWLRGREPVYGYRFEGRWFDIGDLEQLLLADNAVRDLEGLPQRAAYSSEEHT